MKITNYIAAILVLICLSGKTGNSQVTAAFTYTPSSGCAPLSVIFTNQSSPSGNLNYSWKFGNGNFSDLQNPSATYTNPGTYTVTLIVTDNSTLDIDSVKHTIKVFKNPVANFSAIQTGCTPYTAQFTSISVPGDTTITQYSWDFFAGFFDSRQNPTFTYLSPGSYNVYLKVTDAKGCEGNKLAENFISVVNKPVAGFSVTPASACDIPALFSFTNSSAGTGLSYNWNFGDAGTSSLASPTHNYTNFGTYHVVMKANSSYGCSDSSILDLQVNNVVVAGTITQNGIPVTPNKVICPGTVTFTSSTTGTNSIRWEFGDGTTSTSPNTTHDYSVAGAYIVKLIASPGTSCAETLTFNFTVENIKAQFSQDISITCLSPVTVHFTDQSTGAVSWSWSFQGGGTSTLKNPSHAYAVPPEVDEYKINSDEIFTTILTITSANGCKTSTSKNLSINKPTAIYTVDTTSGCKPLQVTFKNKSLSDQPITTYRWIFDNGTIQNSTADSIVYTYLNDAVYIPKLVITNSANCTDTSYRIPIQVGKQLFPDFTVSNTPVCQNDLLQFTDATPQGNLIQNWRYFVDGQLIPSDLSEPDPVWKVNAAPGPLPVKLVVDYNGCISDTIKTGILTNTGPLANFDFNLDCSLPFKYQFANLSQGAVTYEWDFGDASAISNAANPLHTFLTEGVYDVELRAFKGGCSDTIVKTIYVQQPHATIEANLNSCRSVPITLKSSASYSTVNYCYEKYYWNFEGEMPDKRTNIDSIQVSFSERGIYPVHLMATYDNGCIDTATVNIRIYQPFVGFTADTLYGCSPFGVDFVDTSYEDTHPFEKWSWNFDDGSPLLEYTSILNPINHIFSDPGVFQITLTVTDTLGCNGSASANVSTANPDAFFTAVDTLGCLGEESVFQYGYSDPDSAIWDFGDGMVITDTNNPVSHLYLNSGSYPVSLTLYKYACSNTHSYDSNYMKIQDADASFIVSDDSFNCYPHAIHFTYQPKDPVNESLSGWEFGYNNSTGPYLEDAFFTYFLPGDYLARLHIETSYGCTDTSSVNIHISGPTASFDISPEQACKGDVITFNIANTNNVTNYEWDMGDGTPLLQGDTIEHIYYVIGTRYPALIIYGDTVQVNDSTQKLCAVSVIDSFSIYSVMADFSYNDTLCDQYAIRFENLSTSNDNNNWDFGNGITSIEEIPIVQFTPGVYDVELIVSNSIGCTDTSEATLTVNNLPPIQISNDTVLCEGTPIELFSSGGDIIYWWPSDSLRYNDIYNPIANPEITTVYHARTMDTLTGCANIDSVQIFVQNGPELNIYPMDTAIVIGDYLYIHADSLPDVTYSWFPDANSTLSCYTCASPVGRPLESIEYLLTVADTNLCFEDEYTLHIEVKEVYSLELPEAFTPGSNDENSVIKVKGWGIKELQEFRVFNRWGNEVFFSNNIEVGWDGTFKDKPQNMDTYTYTLKAEMWDGRIVTKSGTFTLLR